MAGQSMPLQQPAPSQSTIASLILMSLAGMTVAWGFVTFHGTLLVAPFLLLLIVLYLADRSGEMLVALAAFFFVWVGCV